MHFLCGATKASLTQLQAKLITRFPGLHIVGSLAPPFRALTPAEDSEVVVAATFDIHAGQRRQAPSWMQHPGLEWLFPMPGTAATRAPLFVQQSSFRS